MSYQSLRRNTTLGTTESGGGAARPVDMSERTLGQKSKSVAQLEIYPNWWEIFWALLEPHARERIGICISGILEGPEESGSKESVVEEKPLTGKNQEKLKKGKKAGANSRCWTCGEDGHWRLSCPVRHAKKDGVEEAVKSGETRDKKYKNACWVCEERGHLKSSCPIFLARKAERMKEWGI